MTQPSPSPAPIPRPRARGPIRRRDLYLLIGLAIAVLTFSAISISVNALRPDVPTTSNDSTADPRAQESEFVLHVGSGLPGQTQGEAIAAGRTVCTNLDKGLSREQVRLGLETRGYTPTQAALVFDAAVASLCPEHR